MSAEEQQEQTQRYGQVVAKAWQDEAFKRRLLGEPAAVLEEHGVALPADVEVRMVENTDQVLYLTLPARPGEEELADDQLDEVVGGVLLVDPGALVGGLRSLGSLLRRGGSRMPVRHPDSGASHIPIGHPDRPDGPMMA